MASTTALTRRRSSSPAAKSRRLEAKIDELKTLTSAFAQRMQFANVAGVTFDGKRDIYDALGYTRTITVQQMRDKYRRNGVARRLVTMLPSSTWRAGADLIEDDNPDVTTPWEEAWTTIANNTDAWNRMRKVDVLSQLGQFAVLLIGFPGDVSQEPQKLGKKESIAFLKPYGEASVTIEQNALETNTASPRFGMPNYYMINLTAISGSTGTTTGTATSGGQQKKVHWTRVIHVADETLEDDLRGDPKLNSVWNWLDDLEKVAGAGSEAFWRRVQPLLAAALEPGVTVPDERAVEAEIDKLLHGMRRWARISGIKLEEVGSTDVAQFDRQIDALVGLICAGYGYPKRIFLGSEQGEKASSQDRGNYDLVVRDRRVQFADGVIVRPLIARLTKYGALPEIADGYDVYWPEIRDLDAAAKLELAKMASEVNKNQGETVIKTNEIRDQILGMDPLEEDEIEVVGSDANNGVPTNIEDLRERLKVSKLARKQGKKKSPLTISVQHDETGRTTALRLERLAEGTNGR